MNWRAFAWLNFVAAAIQIIAQHPFHYVMCSAAACLFAMAVADILAALRCPTTSTLAGAA